MTKNGRAHTFIIIDNGKIRNWLSFIFLLLKAALFIFELGLELTKKKNQKVCKLLKMQTFLKLVVRGGLEPPTLRL